MAPMDSIQDVQDINMDIISYQLCRHYTLLYRSPYTYSGSPGNQAGSKVLLGPDAPAGSGDESRHVAMYLPKSTAQRALRQSAPLCLGSSETRPELREAKSHSLISTYIHDLSSILYHGITNDEMR